MFCKNKNYLLLSGIIIGSPSVFATDGEINASFELGYQYDDNISISALSTGSGQSDHSFTVDLSAEYIKTHNNDSEYDFTYDYFESFHNDFTSLDLQIHTLGVGGVWSIDEYDLGLNYSFSKVDLGGSGLYDSHSIIPSIGFSSSDIIYHRLAYNNLMKNFSSGFSGRDAKQNSISLDSYYFFMDAKAYTSLGLKYEVENAKDNELDYKAYYLNFGLSVPVNDGSTSKPNVNMAYQYYDRDYDNVTASIGENRLDQHHSVNFAVTKPLNDTFSVKLNFEHISSKSNLSSSDYNENVVALSILGEI